MKLTFHLESDWLRLYAACVDIQSAAVLPCIGPLHRGNAEIPNMKTSRYAHVACHIFNVHLHVLHT